MTVLVGDCRETLQTLADNSVDSIVTDPPYEIGFMGKGWDGSGVANDPVLWAECYRVLKPGGHVLAFGAARTYHRMACAIEDAGFEIRDSLHWVYGSGFPKSHNVGKGIDRQAGATRTEQIGVSRGVSVEDNQGYGGIARGGVGITQKGVDLPVMAPATDDAKRWEGWGTALKPAHEPIVMARKPFAGTVASNVLEHGTGAINIDGSRIGSDGGGTHCTNRDPLGVCKGHDNAGRSTEVETIHAAESTSGRWPANVILTHSTECDGFECAPDCPALEIDRQSGQTSGLQRIGNPGGTTFGGREIKATIGQWYGGSGGASRFYAQPEWTPGDYLTSIYTPKAGKRERNAGLDTNHHPTVKPVALMRYLIRLVTPPGGLVLDPFLGSGTTAVAAILEGFEWIGCELTSEYLPIIEGRCQWARENIELPEPTLFDGDTQ